MALEVARIVEDWLDEEHVKWEATRDVVDWARAYGTDLQRAWTECPRADFLMAIAGACGADRKIIVRTACSAAREALAFVPAKLALPRKAIHLAETHRLGDNPGGEIPGAMALIQATKALVEKRIAEAQRLHHASREAVSSAVKALAEVVASTVFAPGARELFATDRRVTCVEDITPEMLAWTAEMLEQVMEPNAVVTLQSRTAAFYRMIASGHAARAAELSLSAASSADLEFKCLVLVSSIVKQTRATDEMLARLYKAASIARRSGARVYAEAALLFDHAAGAFGQAEAAGDASWASAIMQLVTTILYSLGRGERDPADRGRFRKTLDAHAERAKAAKLGEHADRVRAVIAVSALSPPQDAADREEALQRDPMGHLRRALTSLAPLTRFLGNADAADAVETAVAILEATGPVNRHALAHALRTVHERMAVAFSRRAGEVTGTARDEMNEATTRAQEAMREVDAAIATLAVEKLN